MQSLRPQLSHYVTNHTTLITSELWRQSLQPHNSPCVTYHNCYSCNNISKCHQTYTLLKSNHNNVHYTHITNKCDIHYIYLSIYVMTKTTHIFKYSISLYNQYSTITSTDKSLLRNITNNTSVNLNVNCFVNTQVIVDRELTRIKI